jgi:hypothetical protein
MAQNPAFRALLTRMGELHDKKNHDYAQDNNPYSNFEEAAANAGCSVDTVFRVLIGIKQARLKELLAGKVPNNEGIEDTKLDLTMYCALWVSYDMSKSEVFVHSSAYTAQNPLMSRAMLDTREAKDPRRI